MVKEDVSALIQFGSYSPLVRPFVYQIKVLSYTLWFKFSLLYVKILILITENSWFLHFKYSKVHTVNSEFFFFFSILNNYIYKEICLLGNMYFLKKILWVSLFLSSEFSILFSLMLCWEIGDFYSWNFCWEKTNYKDLQMTHSLCRNYRLHDIPFLKSFKHLIPTAKQHPRICVGSLYSHVDHTRTQRSNPWRVSWRRYHPYLN